MAKNRKLKKYFNLLSGHHRAYPDFLIIGAQKAATTSLFHYLTQHPQVEPPIKKEVRYFDLKYHWGSVWYRSHFPLKSRLRGNKITGEKSTDYIYHPMAPHRIKSSGLNPKLILLLRDPSLRAISQYKHYYRRGMETRSMRDAFEQEKQLVDQLYPSLEKKTIMNQRKIKDFIRYSYLQKGRYLEQIKRYEEVLGRESLMIESMEKLMQYPEEVVLKAYRFLCIDDSFMPKDLSTQNSGNYPLDRETSSVRTWLDEYYRPHNQQLFEHLGRRFEWGEEEYT